MRLWLILFLSWGGLAFAAPELWPKHVQSEEQITQLAEQIVTRMPEALHGAHALTRKSIAEYLTLARAMSQEISQSKGLNAAWKRAPDPISIFIGPIVKQKFAEFRLDRLSNQQVTSLQDLWALPESDLRTHVLHLAEDVQKRNPSAYFTAAGMVLSAEERQVFYTKGWSPEQRLEFLKTLNVNKESLSAIDWQRFGFEAAAHTASELAERGQILVGNAQAFAHSLLMVSLAMGEAALPLTQDDVNSAFERLQNQPKTIVDWLHAPASLHRILRQAMDQFVAQYVRSAHTTVQRQIELREVPPWLSMLRGGIGADCSTCTSTGVTYWPSERNFFVFKNHRVIGYVSGTKIKVDERRAFRIKDVVLPAGTEADLALVLNAFKKSAAQLGVSKVMIAPIEWHEDQNHAHHIREALERFVLDDEYEVQNINEGLIDEFESKSKFVGLDPYYYDHPDEHTLAVELNSEQIVAEVPSGYGIEVTPAPHPLAGPEGKRLNLSFLEEYAEAWLTGSARPQMTTIPWAPYILNRQRFSLNDYYERLSTPFAKLGAPLSGKLRRRYPNLFAIGHLRAPDAFEPEWLDDSVEILLKQLLRSDPPRFAIELLIQHKDKLEGHPRVQSFLRELLANYHDQAKWRVLSFARAGFKEVRDFFRQNMSVAQQIIRNEVIPSLTRKMGDVDQDEMLRSTSRGHLFIQRGWYATKKAIETRYDVQPLLDQLYADALIEAPELSLKLQNISETLAAHFPGVSLSERYDVIRAYFELQDLDKQKGNFWEWQQKRGLIDLIKNVRMRELTQLQGFAADTSTLQALRWRALLRLTLQRDRSFSVLDWRFHQIVTAIRRQPPERGFGLILLSDLLDRPVGRSLLPNTQASVCAELNYLANLDGQDSFINWIRVHAKKAMSLQNCSADCDGDLE